MAKNPSKVSARRLRCGRLQRCVGSWIVLFLKNNYDNNNNDKHNNKKATFAKTEVFFFPKMKSVRIGLKM